MNAGRRKLLVLLALLVAVLTPLVALPQLRSASFWQGLVKPGPLSAAHQFMENNCSSCHVPIEGVSDTRCTSCHANETALLQRQPTAFHSSIGSCTECHREHEGNEALRSRMDHEALVKIGLRLLAREPTGSEARVLYSHLLAHAPVQMQLGSGALTPNEQRLDCYGCHSNRDRHTGQFGRECGACHGTSRWTIAEYQHPSPSSTDCAQCHRAPPSHYMGHFEMVSKRVAGIEHADVEQCYLCHQATSWNDIKTVGMYDHH